MNNKPKIRLGVNPIKLLPPATVESDSGQIGIALFFEETVRRLTLVRVVQLIQAGLLNGFCHLITRLSAIWKSLEGVSPPIPSFNNTRSVERIIYGIIAYVLNNDLDIHALEFTQFA